MEADTDSLQAFLDNTGLELASASEESDEAPPEIDAGDILLTEVVITPESSLQNQTANRLNLRERHGLNVVALARQGHRLKRRIGDVRFQVGDILLVQGHEESLGTALQQLGCLPLAERGLRLGRERRTLLAGGLFIAAIVSIVAGWLAPPVALVGCAVAMVLTGLLNPSDAYKSIDWSVIVLLAAMIPVGGALEATGGAELIAAQMLMISEGLAPALVLGVLLVGTMLLSNVVNNAAAAILVAPIALSMATELDMASDAVLMAVAVGASCAFLTPIGHQSNALVMEPGGYRFGDYWRLGLPLSILVTVVAVPVILLVWS